MKVVASHLLSLSMVARESDAPHNVFHTRDMDWEVRVCPCLSFA
jgi:hypothetical protein